AHTSSAVASNRISNDWLTRRTQAFDAQASRTFAESTASGRPVRYPTSSPHAHVTLSNANAGSDRRNAPLYRPVRETCPAARTISKAGVSGDAAISVARALKSADATRVQPNSRPNA